MVTRTPCSTSSPRKESANPRSPNFDAAYADQPGLAESPAEELTKTKVPAARRTAASVSRVSTAGATRLTSICSRNWEADCSSTGGELDHAGHVEHRVEPVQIGQGERLGPARSAAKARAPG